MCCSNAIGRRTIRVDSTDTTRAYCSCEREAPGVRLCKLHNSFEECRIGLCEHSNADKAHHICYVSITDVALKVPPTVILYLQLRLISRYWGESNQQLIYFYVDRHELILHNKSQNGWMNVQIHMISAVVWQQPTINVCRSQDIFANSPRTLNSANITR